MRYFCLLLIFAVTPIYSAEAELRTQFPIAHLNTLFPNAPANDAEYRRAEECIRAFQKEAGFSRGVARSTRNPNCCFWMELWRQDRAAYVLRLGPWGYHLTAGSPEALRAALEFLQTLRREDVKGEIQYPLGIYTNTEFHTIARDAEVGLEALPTVVWPKEFAVNLFDETQVDALTKEMTPVLNDFAKEFGFAGVKHLGVNPENCFWVQHWNYSKNAWVLRTADSAPGAHLVAGSTEMLHEALAFIRKTAKKTEQGWVLPVGNFTNLTVKDTRKGISK